jgi:hypothetical protein
LSFRSAGRNLVHYDWGYIDRQCISLNALAQKISPRTSFEMTKNKKDCHFDPQEEILYTMIGGYIDRQCISLNALAQKISPRTSFEMTKNKKDCHFDPQGEILYAIIDGYTERQCISANVLPQKISSRTSFEMTGLIIQQPAHTFFQP